MGGRGEDRGRRGECVDRVVGCLEGLEWGKGCREEHGLFGGRVAKERKGVEDFVFEVCKGAEEQKGL